ncbi:hypothetical protein [Clostridium cadaveris]|uniref:hypothetical protein n=1 Tax=Clostridium cadaveris TaxID=1529 RepID=UPI001E3CB6C4|nr:hypothetical protein [Clostridium cadaveris]UFH63720.1 hypothetical protein KQH81_10095 [Clostridium cadaveris]
MCINFLFKWVASVLFKLCNKEIDILVEEELSEFFSDESRKAILMYLKNYNNG